MLVKFQLFMKTLIKIETLLTFTAAVDASETKTTKTKTKYVRVKVFSFVKFQLPIFDNLD